MKTHAIDTSAMTDAELIRKSRRGDQSAYGQLVERYQSLVCSIAYHRCDDLTLSEDLAQDAFILGWRKLPDLKDVNKFKAWICTIVRNLAHRRNEQRGRNVNSSAARLEAVGEVASKSKSPAEHAVSAEEESLVRQALADVPENYREPLILYYREGQSVSRVAKALDLSESAVKQRLSRGRRMLQQHLAATVESVLEKSIPTKEFASAVLLAIAGLKSKSAAAAGIASGVGLTGNAAAKVGGGLGLGSLFGLLPVFGSLYLACAAIYQSIRNEMRSPAERELLDKWNLRFIISLVAWLVIFALLQWWAYLLQPGGLRQTVSLLSIATIALGQVPAVYYSKIYGKQLEKLRADERAESTLAESRVE